MIHDDYVIDYVIMMRTVFWIKFLTFWDGSAPQNRLEIFFLFFPNKEDLALPFKPL